MNCSESSTCTRFPFRKFLFFKTAKTRKNKNKAYLALKNVNLPVFDVDLVSHLVELVGDAVLVLGGRERGLRLLLDHLVLILKLAPQLVDLRKTSRFQNRYSFTSSKAPSPPGRRTVSPNDVKAG